MAKTVYMYTFVNAAGITNIVSQITDSNTGKLIYQDKDEQYTKPVGEAGPRNLAHCSFNLARKRGELITLHCNITGTVTVKRTEEGYDVNHMEGDSIAKHRAFIYFKRIIDELYQEEIEEHCYAIEL